MAGELDAQMPDDLDAMEGDLVSMRGLRRWRLAPDAGAIVQLRAQERIHPAQHLTSNDRNTRGRKHIDTDAGLDHRRK